MSSHDRSNAMLTRQFVRTFSKIIFYSGSEAAVHAARLYLRNLQTGSAMVKLDFCNAFNTIRRDKMLEATLKFAPDIFPFVFSAYSASSSLFWEGRVIQSAEGLQQGDPLGPLLFCLATQSHVSSFTSEFCVCYIDDVTLGGPSVSILYDLGIVYSMEEIGLSLNCRKSEVICCDELTSATILSSLPGAQIIEPSAATLLGSPLGSVESVSVALGKKIDSLATMGDRLDLLAAQDALLLLRYSFAIPKLSYLLRTAPCFLSPCLRSYDELLCSIVSRVCNVNVSIGDTAWLQASLPVNLGGLGFRSAVQLAPSAFSASAAASVDLMSMILPGPLPATACDVDLALSCWSSLFTNDNPPLPPSGDDAKVQRIWDSLLVNASLKHLIGNADESTKARLLAVSTPEAGAWLRALPVANLGLRMDDSAVRVSVGLRLGLPLSRPHLCDFCGALVDKFATHHLSCKRSGGRFYRHSSVNAILHRAFVAAAIPARLEPTGLSRSDGKRPDGVTMVPWECGKCVVWDFTCPDTLAPSYRSIAASNSAWCCCSFGGGKEKI